MNLPSYPRVSPWGDEFDQPPHMADIAEQLNHRIDGGRLKFD
nr:hypothetical protein [Alistipes onderdonkii]